MDISLSELWEMVMDREAWHAVIYRVAKSGHDWATELNWTELNTEEQLQLGGISIDNFDKKTTKANSYKMLYTVISLC